MLKASRAPRERLRDDYVYHVTSTAVPAGTVNETRCTIETKGRSYTVLRKGLFAPEYQLKSDDAIVAVAAQKPFVNTFRLVHHGKEWTFKAISLRADRFGLFDGATPAGTVTSGSFANKFTDITVDLPDALAVEVQLFVLLLAIRAWSQQAT